MHTVVDWTPRKRLKDGGPLIGVRGEDDPSGLQALGDDDASPDPSGAGPSRAAALHDEAPFAFVRRNKKAPDRMRCQLACCTAITVPVSEEVDNQMTILAADVRAVFLLPPPCDVGWFSGICVRTGGSSAGESGTAAVHDGYNSDPFMDGVEYAAAEDARGGDAAAAGGGGGGVLEVIGHELEIDDCLRCAAGGYQRFRVAVTDRFVEGGARGTALVERTGGDFVDLDAPSFRFRTSQSFSAVRIICTLPHKLARSQNS